MPLAFIHWIGEGDNGLRPTHPIMLPGMPGWGVGSTPPFPVDPGYGIDINTGWLRPSHPIALPGDPWWGNDPWRPKPTHPIALPGDPWWGTDLKPTHPIMLPGMPGWGVPPGGYIPGLKPTHPIALPGDPWWGTIGDRPDPPTPGQPPGQVINVLVIPLENQPGVPPPAGIPADSTPAIVWFGVNTKPTVAWIPPYASAAPPGEQPTAEPKRR
jgi:hypothetical protein